MLVAIVGMFFAVATAAALATVGGVGVHAGGVKSGLRGILVGVIAVVSVIATVGLVAIGSMIAVFVTGSLLVGVAVAAM